MQIKLCVSHNFSTINTLPHIYIVFDYKRKLQVI